ncbi:MAG: exodeoxyribonuclease I [Xanthomonadales bacterium]|nr:exodeoxyribonuclease I [Xanthomonadales bacterium]
MKTFLWHDYETFGANPMADRPAQFAAVRTNPELKEIGEPVTWYCSPSDDVLPHPMASLITGITPQEAKSQGLPETGFAARILEEMSQPGTCSAGYNSIRFDDTVTRNLFYRNLRDPYEREYRNGNSRWDLIDLARMCYALRPEGIEWPMHEPGKPSFRLEDLSHANGIAHEGAHDALADVRATIGLARLLKNAQPRLFEWALQMRDFVQAKKLLDTVEPVPVLHTSARIPATRGCTAMVLPLAVVPDRPKSVIVFDLSADPGPLLTEPADVIHDLVFTSSADLPEGIERLPLKVIHGNHVPMLAPTGTLRGVDTGRIDLDPKQCKLRAQQILSSLEAVRQKVIDAFALPGEGFAESSDPDRMLYSGGFFSSADRHLMKKILDVPPEQLGGHMWSFQDKRLPLMLFRYRARNYPETLSQEEARTWDKDRRSRLVETADPEYFTLSDFRATVKELRESESDRPEAQRILDKLESWVVESGISDL